MSKGVKDNYNDVFYDYCYLLGGGFRCAPLRVHQLAR